MPNAPNKYIISNEMKNIPVMDSLKITIKILLK